MIINDLLSRLQKVEESGSGAWMACCPAHDDKGPSLSIKSTADGKILLKCFAGCELGAVVGAMGLEVKDLFPAKPEPVKKARVYPKVTAVYDYHAADGAMVYQVLRKDDKSFSQRVPNPDFDAKNKESKANPRWLYGRTRFGVGAMIFRLPRVLATAAKGGVVFVAEGEKDVLTLEGLGLVATCNSGGVGKWEHGFSAHLKGCKAVVILADNDPGKDEVPAGKKYWQGQQHALLVEKSLNEIGINNTKVMVMPEIGGAKVKDISDWVAAGGNLEQFRAAVKSAPPLSPQQFLITEQTQPSKAASSDVDPEEPLWKQIGIALYVASTGDREANENKRLTSFERQKIITATVFGWLRLRGKFFHHADYRDHASAMYFDSSMKVLRLIDSDQFQSWLARESKINRTDRSFAHCISHLHDMSLSSEHSVGVIPSKFFERVKDTIYVSCGDTHIVKIGAGEVEKVDNGTDNVVFGVGHTLAPWELVDAAKAVDPFIKCSLFSGMAASDPAGKLLTQLWFLGVLYGHVTKPPIVFAGGVGSGKTRTAVGFFELLGLPPRVTGITEKMEDDFWVSLDHGGLVTWDNADTRNKWLPDALAAAATNGSHEARKKYSDSDIIRHEARANIIVTSANPTFAGDAGLADRLIVVRLERNQRETAESRLSREIAQHRDASLTWITYILSTALGDKACVVPPGLNRRHPDWAEFALKCGRAMGREGDALAAIRSAEMDKSRFAIENDFYGSLLLQLIPAEGVNMTSTELCELIAEHSDLDERSKKDISPRKLGKRLDKLWPHVEQVFQATKSSANNRNIYKLVGLVGLNANFNKSTHVTFLNKFSQNSPSNQPNQLQGVLYKESEEVESLDLDWLDGEND